MLLKVVLSFWLAVVLGGPWLQTPGGPQITAPQGGDALQGVVEISGSSQVEGFLSAEVAYAYETGQQDGWFLLEQTNEQVENGRLAGWDTTTIADGTYRLRLRVIKKDGTAEEALIRGLRVRNYTPVETRTPASAPSAQPEEPKGAAVSATATPGAAEMLPTPTRLPENPARINEAALGLSMVQGAAFTLVLFLLFGLYAAVRAFFKGR